jgi:glycosyltransferase involved in cell wall biosynthesis
MFKMQDTRSSEPKVIILMCTYNGEKYLTEQLHSIFSQTCKNIEVWVSDDGSSDSTLDILQAFQTRYGEKLVILQGPRKGFSTNFLSLVCNRQLDGDYFAFSDQDDIWLPHKLQNAIDKLVAVEKHLPSMYCGRTKLVDETGRFLGHSPLFTKKPAFLNAVVQSIGGGNTMVFNKRTLGLLQDAGEDINIIAHDWWTYLAVTGAGGVVFYDHNPTLDYRQHANNKIGGNVGWLARLVRLRLLFKGRFRAWNDANFKALHKIRHHLTEENQRILADMIATRDCWWLGRVIRYRKLGIYRQTLAGNMGLVAAALFNKI